MFTYDKKAVDAMTGPARQMFEQWISFFPTAPLFGVEWRFANSLNKFPGGLGMDTPGFSLFTSAMTGRSQKAADPAPNPRPAPAARPQPAEDTVVVVAKATPAPEAKEPKPAEKPAAKAAEAEARNGGGVEQIRGIGPRLAAELSEMGITTIAQIAALTRAELTEIDAKLTSIRGRCFRDDWIGQAKTLMAA